MSKAERRIVTFLKAKRDRLMAVLEKKGGRSVALAEHIDRLDAAIDALEGCLVCQHCEAQLTGNA